MNLNINDILSQKDKRSTIMIKNIPNKFNQEYILSIINQNFRGTFDVFVLPTDIKKLLLFVELFYYLFSLELWLIK